jgi:hypothetical protein
MEPELCTDGHAASPANKPNGEMKNPPPPFQPPTPPVQPLDAADPFSAENFPPQGEDVPTPIDDLAIEVGVPDDEIFVCVSPDPRHHIKATLLIVKKEGDGFGKTYYFLTPLVAAWAKAQSSLKKFVKQVHIFLYKDVDGNHGLWIVRDSLDTWAVSELQVALQAKTVFTRRFAEGKQRKGHSSDAIPVGDVKFPDRALIGSDGLLKQAFGAAFVITDVNHPTLNRLLGKQ